MECVAMEECLHDRVAKPPRERRNARLHICNPMLPKHGNEAEPADQQRRDLAEHRYAQGVHAHWIAATMSHLASTPA
jgi:hypothetical protein